MSVPSVQPKRQPRRVDDQYIHMHVSDLTTPKPGRICYGPRWWHVTADGEVLFYKHYTSPQCNVDRRVLEYHGIEGCTPQFIEMAFIPHRCSDYV